MATDQHPTSSPTENGTSQKPQTGRLFGQRLTKKEDGSPSQSSSLLSRLRELEEESSISPYEADMEESFPDITDDPDEFAAAMQLDNVELSEETAVSFDESLADEGVLEEVKKEMAMAKDMPATIMSDGAAGTGEDSGAEFQPTFEEKVEVEMMEAPIEEAAPVNMPATPAPVAPSAIISGRDIAAQYQTQAGGYQYDAAGQIDFAGMLVAEKSWQAFGEQLKNINFEIIAASGVGIFSVEQTREIASSLIDAIVESSKPKPNANVIRRHVYALHNAIMGETELLGFAFDLNLAACAIDRLA